MNNHFPALGRLRGQARFYSERSVSCLPARALDSGADGFAIPMRGQASQQQAADGDHSADQADVRNAQLADDHAAQQRATADADVVNTGMQRHGHRPDRRNQQAARELVVVTAEHHRAQNAGAAEQQENHRGHVAGHLRDELRERFDVAVRRELRGYDQGCEQIQRHQRRAFEQHRQAAQRPRILARQQRQRFHQHQHSQARRHGNGQERGTPAQRFAQHAAQRNAKHHRQRRAGRQQTEGLNLLTLRRHAHRQGGSNGPEYGVRHGDAHTADQQHGEARRQARHHMAGNEHEEHEQQQLAPLDVAGQQHHRQRGQRHNPRIHSKHQADLRGGHVKAVPDGAQQAHWHEFGRVENEGSQRQRDHAQPTSGVCVSGVYLGGACCQLNIMSMGSATGCCEFYALVTVVTTEAGAGARLGERGLAGTSGRCVLQDVNQSGYPAGCCDEPRRPDALRHLSTRFVRVVVIANRTHRSGLHP
nr:hypothetical protein [Tanacetum cinerariifolium]